MAKEKERRKRLMQTIKNVGYAAAGVGALWLSWQAVGVVTWASTVPLSLGLKFVEYGALAVAGYVAVVHGAKKFASLFE